MFNSSHTLVGLALSRTGLDRWTRHAALTAVLAANLPDIDIVTGLHSTAAYIDYHRGFTHSLLGIPVISGILAAVLRRFSGNFWKTFAVAFLSMATHPLLDYTNTYGVRPFLPFDGTWYYGDILFIIDPYLDCVLLLGLVAGYLSPNRRRVLAASGLLLVTAYVGVRVGFRNQSQMKLAEWTARTTDLEKSAVSPHMATPLEWTGIVKTKNAAANVEVHALRGVTGEIIKLNDSGPSSIISRAAQSRAGTAFLGFARFPVVRVHETEAGYTVKFLDLRYYREATRTAFGANVQLDHSLQIMADAIGFDEPID